MPCYTPLKGYRSREITKNGKHKIVFNLSDGFQDQKIDVACGQCIGCRLDRARHWAIRCIHEASMHDDNCFITLTYNDENLPYQGSLVLEDFQKFMKRLRKENDKKIRFFHCGEYGDQMGRPHYHACIFGIDFADRKIYNDGMSELKSSEKLRRLWPYGYNTVGEITPESAAYVARYVVKKVTGEKAFEHYTDFDKNTGEILSEKKPEYVTMSRRPGIAADWIEKYMADVYPSDTVIMNEKEVKPPKFYDSRYEILYPAEMKKIKLKRQDVPQKVKVDNEPERLAVKCKLAELKNKRKKGRLENEEYGICHL